MTKLPVYSVPMNRFQFFRSFKRREKAIKSRYPLAPPQVFKRTSSTSADLPMKYCINSMQKDTPIVHRIIHLHLRRRLYTAGKINPSGTNIMTLAISCVICFRVLMPHSVVIN